MSPRMGLEEAEMKIQMTLTSVEEDAILKMISDALLIVRAETIQDGEGPDRSGIAVMSRGLAGDILRGLGISSQMGRR